MRMLSSKAAERGTLLRAELPPNCFALQRLAKRICHLWPQVPQEIQGKVNNCLLSCHTESSLIGTEALWRLRTAILIVVIFYCPQVI